jgi:tetratricopeptide (TPR) repeat protein
MKKLFFLLCILSTTVIVAQQSNTSLFKNANTFYKDGKYKEAIDLFKKIEVKDSVSSTLYYNIANSYYKLNSVANTIYYYEKAIQLDPLNTDAINNLEFARRMTIDNIKELPKTFLQRLEANYIQKLSYNQWSILAVFLSFLASILFILFYVSSISNRKRVYFLTSILSFFLLAITIGISYNQYKRVTNTKTAIIFTSKISVNNAPTLNSNEIFILHEGTKVVVLDTVDNWKKIKLADGKIGWITASSLKEL